jgi:hypothetical protein
MSILDQATFILPDALGATAAQKKLSRNLELMIDRARKPETIITLACSQQFRFDLPGLPDAGNQDCT